MPDTVERSDPRPGIALVTLNRPERLNAMSHELVGDLHATLDGIAADPGVRVVVLTGAGRGFCAGLDLVDGAAVPGTEDRGRVQRGLATQQHIAVVPDGAVVDAALDVAAEIAANSPLGVRMTKEVMWSQLEVGSLHAGIDLENRTQIMTSFSEDTAEAMTAFVQKRAPAFRDR